VTTERLEATVRGDVQGVGFRLFTIRRARQLGLAGWVANEPGGSVRVIAEGPPEAITELLRLLWEGPSGARVTDVEHRRLAASGGFDGFEVRARGHAGD
jgi:acylphosphatase